MCIIGRLKIELVRDTNPVQLGPSNVAEDAARAGFPNISTEAFYPGSIEGPASALDDIDFDAPIFGIINWPGPWTGWIQTENTAGNIESRMP